MSALGKEKGYKFCPKEYVWMRLDSNTTTLAPTHLLKN